MSSPLSFGDACMTATQSHAGQIQGGTSRLAGLLLGKPTGQRDSYRGGLTR